MRAAGPEDLESFLELRERAGPGFTSLMVDDAAMQAKLELSAASFASKTNAQGPERYLLALEHIATRQVVGCAGVKATIGEKPPFFNFRIIREAQSSIAADRRFDLDVLIGVNDFTGCTEVGSLFVRAEHRGPGVGRALAQARYLLMANAPHRFNEKIVSELRGVVSADGSSPFWEAVGRHFFKMDFAEADKLSATTDNQFILDLMPQHPIYVDLLPADARAVIGKCHKDGEGARALLEWEGFSFSSVIDIFDGGPLVSAPRDHVRTLREARRRILSLAENAEGGRRGLVVTAGIGDFRCVAARIDVQGNTARVGAAAISALNLAPGAEALVWVSEDAV